MKRKPIPRDIRQKVYDKYQGHCAYCGCELEYKDMQVDHIDSVYRAECEDRQAEESIDNYNPACRQCNFYKDTNTIEEFRDRLLRFEEKYLMAGFDVRLGLRYGMIIPFKWDGKFYFERYV